MTHPGIPAHRLDLKVNVICAIQRNLSVEKGLVHNARVQIVALHHRFIEVQMLDRPDIICIPRITFNFRPFNSNWTVQRKQFPLRAAYATTFNSCQGLTLDRSCLDLRIDPFAHGQLYTALSRVRCRQHSLAIFSHSNAQKDVANVVYRSLLL